MKLAVLASGSKGNCTYIETNNLKILIDIGMTNLYIEKALKSINVEAKDIDYVFITHIHTDHTAGLKVFLKKNNPIVFLTKKMYEELSTILELKNYEIIEDKIVISDTIVEYFKTSHDTSDSLGYIFTSKEKSIVYVTDTGYINIKNFPLLKNKDIYVFESNHDVSLLMNNPNYPYHTKQRILGDKGHLSNDQASEYLERLSGDKTKCIILAHLSEQNNDPIIAINTLKEKVKDVEIVIASQNERTNLIEL